MTEAEARAALAAQGRFDPRIYYSPDTITAGDIQAAQAPSGGIASYVPAITQGIAQMTKEPTLQEQYIQTQIDKERARQGLPPSAGAGAGAAGLGAAAGIGGIFDGIGAGIGGLFGGGGTAAATTTAAAPSATASALGLGGATEAANMSMIPAAQAAEMSAAASPGMLATMAPYIAAPLAVYGAYETVKGIGNIAGGDKLTMPQQVAMALPTFGASFLYNPVKDMFGGKKDKDQQARDQYRSGLKDSGMLDDNYNLTLKDGSKFDFGADGSKGTYNVDFSQQGIGGVVGSVNPLAAIMANGTGKQQNDLAGQFTNAVRSSGDARANAINLYEQAGLDRDSAWKAVDDMVTSGKLDRTTGDAFKAGIDSTFGIGQPTNKKPAAKPSGNTRNLSTNNNMSSGGNFKTPTTAKPSSQRGIGKSGTIDTVRKAMRK